MPDIEPEQDRAERHKAAITAALLQVIPALEAARMDGFLVEYGTNINQYGKYAINPPITLIKRF